MSPYIAILFIVKYNTIFWPSSHIISLQHLEHLVTFLLFKHSHPLIPMTLYSTGFPHLCDSPCHCPASPTPPSSSMFFFSDIPSSSIYSVHVCVFQGYLGFRSFILFIFYPSNLIYLLATITKHVLMIAKYIHKLKHYD